MTTQLFRQEVTDAKRTSWLGGLSLAQPHRLWLLTIFTVMVALIVVGFLIFGSYSRRTQVPGQLVPDLGLATVVAPISGVVSSTLLAEGDEVEDGAGLIQISTSRSTSDGQDAVASFRVGLDARDDSVTVIGQSQIAQVDSQILGVTNQLSVAREELQQIEQASVTLRQQVRLAERAVERYRGLAGEKFVSQLEVDQQEQALLAQVSEQHALKRQASAVRREIVRLEQTLRELPLMRTVQAANTRRDSSLVRQERVQQEVDGGLLIKAPLTGVVSSRLVEAGQSVQVGQPLLSILPEGSVLEAQLWVPSRAVGFVARGDKVVLRYQAYPYQKFGHHFGRITRIARSSSGAARPGDVTGEARSTETYYRVLVALEVQAVTAYGKAEPLRPGMALEADILSERRQLYEWLFEPLYSLRGRLGESGQGAR